MYIWVYILLESSKSRVYKQEFPEDVVESPFAATKTEGIEALDHRRERENKKFYLVVNLPRSPEHNKAEISHKLLMFPYNTIGAVFAPPLNKQ